MSMLTFIDQHGERVGERWYMVGEAAGHRMVHEAAMLAALLHQAVADDSLPKVTRDMLLARALAQAEAHTHSMVIQFDDKPVSLRV